MLCVGTAAAALAGVQTGAASGTTGVCHTLPSAPASPPPGPTPSLSPGATSTGSATITQLCISVQPTASTIQAGQKAPFVVDVWPVGGDASNVTVQISDSPASFGTPAFNVCGNGDGTTTCSVGVLRANQTTQLQAEISMPTSATTGQSATLGGTATGVATGATASGSVSSVATVTVSNPTPTPTPTPTKTSTNSTGHGHSSGSGSGGSGSGLTSGLGTTSPLSGLLPLASGGSGSSGGANPGNLFPTITPSPGTAGSAGPGGATAKHSPYRARTVADILPLNSRQLGSQIAGLVVLALGIIIAVARISLRKPRTQSK